MKLRDILNPIIVTEDGDSAGTVSSDIATVSYPLFVKGSTRKEKRKNARLAVGQRPTKGSVTSMIGRGIYESTGNEIIDAFHKDLPDMIKDLKAKKIPAADMRRKYGISWKVLSRQGSSREDLIRYGEELLRRGIDEASSAEMRAWFADYDGKPTNHKAVKRVAGIPNNIQSIMMKIKNKLPISREERAKYAAFIKGPDAWVESIKENAQDSITLDIPLMIRIMEYAREDAQHDQDLHNVAEKLIELGLNGRTLTMADYEEIIHGKGANLDTDIPEAYTLNSDNVIYRLDRENPMDDTEVLVIGGAGRYSLKGLRDKARKEAAALSDELNSEHGVSFRDAASHVNQLTNTLNTIVAAYNELKRIRQKGGRGSRGIRSEDANFVRECLGILNQYVMKINENKGKK